jgi:hypothetical protein
VRAQESPYGPACLSQLPPGVPHEFGTSPSLPGLFAAGRERPEQSSSASIYLREHRRPKLPRASRSAMTTTPGMRTLCGTSAKRRPTAAARNRPPPALGWAQAAARSHRPRPRRATPARAVAALVEIDASDPTATRRELRRPLEIVPICAWCAPASAATPPGCCCGTSRTCSCSRRCSCSWRPE